MALTVAFLGPAGGGANYAYSRWASPPPGSCTLKYADVKGSCPTCCSLSSFSHTQKRRVGLATGQQYPNDKTANIPNFYPATNGTVMMKERFSLEDVNPVGARLLLVGEQHVS